MSIFPIEYNQVLKLIDAIDVKEYANSRNYFDGAVSHLSPYLSRGVITLPHVKQRILARHSFEEAYRFIFELAWREYFQKVWWQKGNAIYTDLNAPQTHVAHSQLVKSITEATTGIHALDKQIEALYETGYMHNHARMYTASLATTLAKAHWWYPSKWMYYHLLDGDLASNSLSWQWVAGTFSTKKYYFNQENVNKYSKSTQHNTLIDVAYESLPHLDIPTSLKEIHSVALNTTFPKVKEIILDPTLPLLIYNSYNVDPVWRNHMEANRILLLEPTHFKRFPVSTNVMDFILKLSENIKGIQIFVGEVNELTARTSQRIYSKQHPAFLHYPGEQDAPHWMFISTKVLGSFTSFWKACEKEMH